MQLMSELVTVLSWLLQLLCLLSEARKTSHGTRLSCSAPPSRSLSHGARTSASLRFYEIRKVTSVMSQSLAA